MSNTHRRLLTSVALVLVSCGAPPLPKSPAKVPPTASVGGEKGPPVARVEPVVDDYYGTQITDPYRWMEDPKDPDWLPFLKGQNAYTRSALDAIPGRAKLLQSIQAVSGDAAETRSVQHAGGFLFYEQRQAGSDNYALFVRAPDGKTRTLIDPTQMKSDEGHMSLDWWSASYDGSHVVYGLSPAGSEASVLHVMVAATGEILPESIPMTDFATPNWLPDGSGFFYLQLTGERGTPSLYADSRSRLHRLRTDPEKDAVVLERGLYPEIGMEPVQMPLVVTTPGSESVLAIVADIRTETSAWTASLKDLVAGRPKWRRAFGFDDIITGFALRGDDLYVIDTKNARRGRVLKMSAAKPDLASAREVLPEGEAVVEQIYAARDGALAVVQDGGINRIRRIPVSGKVGDVPLPFDGEASVMFTSPKEDGAYLKLASWLQPSGVWRLDGAGSVSDTGINPRPAIDLSPYEAVRGFATAKDGVRIPYTLISRKGLRRDGGNPTLITGYGAYQLSYTPFFSPDMLPFLDAGGVYVVANVRGGGEYGRDWHKAGQKATKPNTWRDLIAVCETMISDGVTAPEHLAVMGASAGGITVGRALTERPELFAAAISRVGWSNPIRYTAEQNVSDIDEWGPIVDADSFRIMLAMDSYQAVQDGAKYPAVLCTTGATDPRVAPWHATKFAARLQAATASGNPVLLRIDFDAGHGVGSTRSQTDELAADMYAFVLWRTGAAGFQPR
jgi:prolyl oligopeptidase